MELPQLRHSPGAGGVGAHETTEKQAQNGYYDPPDAVRFSGSAVDSDRLVLKGRTLWDETIAALSRALDKAGGTAERLAILAEIRAWREGRS
jgi:hypothetical protein